MDQWRRGGWLSRCFFFAFYFSLVLWVLAARHCFFGFCFGSGGLGVGSGLGLIIVCFCGILGYFFVCHFYFYLLLTNNGVRFFSVLGVDWPVFFLFFFFFSFALRYGTRMRNGMQGGAFCGLLLITFRWGLYY
jgi:hypothetical protein